MVSTVVVFAIFDYLEFTREHHVFALMMSFLGMTWIAIAETRLLPDIVKQIIFRQPRYLDADVPDGWDSFVGLAIVVCSVFVILFPC